MNKHFYLKNRAGKHSTYSRKRGFDSHENDEGKEEKQKIISPAKIKVLKANYQTYNNKKEQRDRNRTLKLPVTIDFIKISFYKTFNYELQKVFVQKYGFLPVDYTDFNRTVLFEIEDRDRFQNFREHLEQITEFEEPVEYSGKEFNLIALIQEFSFFDKRLNTHDTEGLIISVIPKSSRATNIQFKELMFFLNELEVNIESDIDQEFIYVEKLDKKALKILEGDFDVIKGIMSSRPLTVRPGAYGEFRVEYGFDVEIPDNLPIVGIIDTGIASIQPLKDLLVGTINITGETNADVSGHGTLVAGLAAFGTTLPFSVKQAYTAKCKLLSIKILHKDTDPIDFSGLLVAIKKAHADFGVRIFNMSIVFNYIKKYNEAYSDFAYELDKLTHELDILIFISVGNFDSTSLKSLLQEDYIPDHDYPEFFYNLNSQSEFHDCRNTNIAVPAESLNNVSIGALAGNIEDGENSDVTPLNIYPAYYTRKFHFDYSQKVNGSNLKRNQKNKHLNKPDMVFDGGDYFEPESGIEVLTHAGEFFERAAGTSLSTPLVTSMAADILTVYPELKLETVKALLINSASYYTPSHIPIFKEKNKLLRKLIGFGKPKEELLIQSADNSIAFVIEDEIKSGGIMAIPINLPAYLKTSGNKLIFNITLAYKFSPKRGGHLDYLPVHISFNLLKNMNIKYIAKATSDKIYIKKNGIRWSEDNFGVENCLFSNTQHEEYRLQPNDLMSLDGELAIAVRNLVKPEFESDELYPFSIVIRVEEELKNQTNFKLYDEMAAVNELEIIGDIEGEGEVALEVD